MIIQNFTCFILRNFFNINNLYVAYDKKEDSIVDVVCIVDKGTELDYDYKKLREVNDRYAFTIDNYIMGINEYNIVPIIFPKSSCKMSKLQGRMSTKLDIFKDKKTLNENKQRFLQEIEPKWIEEARQNGI